MKKMEFKQIHNTPPGQIHNGNPPLRNPISSSDTPPLFLFPQFLFGRRGRSGVCCGFLRSTLHFLFNIALSLHLRIGIPEGYVLPGVP